MANRGINKAIIVGNLGNEPDVAYLPSGDCVATLSVATSESWTDKQTGQPKEDTQWHRIKAFGKLAEIMRDYLHKGSQIYIEGKLKTDKWTDNQGIERYTTYIQANTMQMLGGKSDGVASQNQPNMRDNGNSGSNASNKQFQTPAVDDGFDNSDIPF